MSVALKTEELYVTPEEYLAAETVALDKHEYLAGAVYAMAGGTRVHDLIATNVLSELHAQLRDKPCIAFSSDVKVHIRTAGQRFYYYPDVSVDCSGASLDAIANEEPVVIFEVLSEGTRRIDQGEKFLNYQTIPSLRSYVLIDQIQPAVTVWRRSADGWRMELLSDLGGTIALPEIACTLPLSAVYERMAF